MQSDEQAVSTTSASKSAYFVHRNELEIFMQKSKTELGTQVQEKTNLTT